MNPPFNVFSQVLDKIQRDKAHVLLIIPAWNKRQFTTRAMGMALASYTWPKETLLFERRGEQIKGTHWAVYALLICGHHPRCEVGDVVGTTVVGGDKGGSQDHPPNHIDPGGVLEPSPPTENPRRGSHGTTPLHSDSHRRWRGTGEGRTHWRGRTTTPVRHRLCSKPVPGQSRGHGSI